MTSRTKDLCYFIIVGLCGSCLYFYLKPEIPPTVYIVIGCVIAVIGIILVAIEQSVADKEHFFYAYASNWNGSGIVNGSFILGTSLFFFAANIKICFFSALLELCAICLLTHKKRRK